jgi:hypothetical protein
MFWVVSSVVGFWEVNNDSPFECSTGPDLSSGEEQSIQFYEPILNVKDMQTS